MNKLWNEFVYCGHLLSLGAAAIIYTCGVLVGKLASWEMMLIAYLFSQTAYMVDRYAGLSTDSKTNPGRSSHVRARAGFLLIALIVAPVLAGLIMLAEQRWEALWFGLGVMLYSAAYPMLKNVTKWMPGFKTLYVSVGWCLLVLLFAFFERVVWSPALGVCLVFVFLRWVLNTSLCDVKDVQADAEEGLRTLAVSLGTPRLVLLLHFVNFTSVAVVGLGVWFRLLPTTALALVLTWPYGCYYLSRVARGGTRTALWVYDVVVDGEYLFWPVFLWLASSCAEHNGC